MHELTRRNLDYYTRLDAGRADYWRYMAAPRFRARVIREEIARHQPGSVLDVGCGDGGLLAAIRSAVPDATLAGIDLSQPQIETNRKAMPEIDWYAGDIESADLDLPQRFEAITASEVIEHLVDPARFLRSIHRLAAPGAVLVVSTQSGRMGETEKHVGHVRHFTREEMSALLSGNGWTPCRVWNAGFPFHDLSKRAANLSPAAMLDQFGGKPYGPVQRFIAAVLRLLFRFNSNTRGAQLFAVARRPA